jgi:beta-lactamase class A
MNEAQPGMLDKKITFSTPFQTTKNTHFVSKSIEVGKSYSIRELLKYMIEYSDNNATSLLNQHIDVPIFKKVFTDLGLTLPDWNSSDYPMTAQDFSVFMKVLYNASYLSIRDSEACLALLANSDFKDGIRAGVPQGCRIVHKFGEGGADNNPDLSESAIIFSPAGTYLLTIMVNGRDMQKLPQAISGISRKAYEQMNSIQGGRI